MNTITITLDEAQPFRPLDARGLLRKDVTYEIYVSGEVDIAYSDEDSWEIEQIRLATWNGKLGAACVSGEEVLDSDSPLFTAIEKYLEQIRDADIVNAICEDIGERRAEYLDRRDEYHDDMRSFFAQGRV
jgi:hypothetical protein